jgi:hypothetical protein
MGRANGRKLGRAFLGFLRTNFLESANDEKKSRQGGGQSRLIIPG